MNFCDCLPSWIVECIKGTNVREIRLRNGAVVRVNVDGHWRFCSFVGLTDRLEDANCLDVDCNDIVQMACNSSIYAYEQMLAQGYFTLEGGARFGVAGSYSMDGQAFKDYSSICIRLPHSIPCANEQILSIARRGNTLIVGAPGKGKTTLLRDVARELSTNNNVVVVDERGELDVCNDLLNCDILKWTSKSAGIEMALRCLSPNFIVCDELANNDFGWITRVSYSGVNIIASYHAGSIEQLNSGCDILGCFQNVVFCQQVGQYKCIDVKQELF